MRRRNPADPRRRRAGRRRGDDPQAAADYLWEVVRSGQWFVVPTPDEDWPGPPYPSTINARRAAWVRLLGYLKWPRARLFQDSVSSTVPEFGPSTLRAFQRMGGQNDPMHLLAAARPFNRIGPKVADELGSPVMRALAMAAVKAVAHLSMTTANHIPEAIELEAELYAIGQAYRSRVIGPDPNAEYYAYRREVDGLEDRIRGLLRLVGSARHDLWLEGDPRADPDPAAWARYHALEAFRSAFDIRHFSDMPGEYAGAIFHATMALGFACDADMGHPLKDAPRGEWYMIRRPKGNWADRAGTGPQRGCMRVANREIKKAMLGPALLTIAGQVAQGR